MRDYWFEIRRCGDPEIAWRQEYEIIFVLEGEGSLQLEGDESRCRLVAGDIFTVNSFQLCNLQMNAGALALVLLVSPLFVAACSPETPNPRFDCRSFLYQAEAQQPFDQLRGDFARAFRAEYKNESQHTVHQRSRVVTLLADLFLCFLGNCRAGSSDSGRQRLQAAVEYIHTHYAEPVTLAQLSEQTFLSIPYLSRSFAKHLGISFTQYLAQVRTRKAALLLTGRQTVTDIAYACGFCSANALIEAFKHQYGETPGQYRRRMEQQSRATLTAGAHTSEGFSMAFATLMRYAEQAAPPEQTVPACLHDIAVSLETGGSRLRHSWKRMINIGYAHDLLSGAIQEQVRRVQQQVGFGYLRCKGLLDDDMMLCTRDMEGQLCTNFVYLDEAIDFILSTGAKPMLEFGHMPSVLAAHHNKMFCRPTLIAPPADVDMWGGLITDVMNHLQTRYGCAELEKWLFVPWVTPEFSVFQLFTLEQYLATYRASFRAIKQVGQTFCVCGPGININNLSLVEWFLNQSQRESILPDILSFHAFGAVEPDTEPDALRLIQNNEAFHMAVSGDERYLYNTRSQIENLLQAQGLAGLPVMLDEWSNNIWQRDLCNDTCYKSAYIFKNILENYDNFYAMGYFCLNDRLDELPPSQELFCGGFGLFTSNGLPKSAFGAFALLARVGQRLLTRGDGYFITETADEVQVLLYNYSHYDGLYRYRHTTNLTKTQRYKVFNERAAQAYHIRLEGLSPGEHRVCRYSISPSGGSTFDAWVSMGAPETPTAQELMLLHRHSDPIYHTELLHIEQGITLKSSLVPHEVQLITISR